MATPCPRCQAALDEAQLDTYRVSLCKTCRGALLAHADLPAILESGWRVVSRDFAEKTEFHAPEGWHNEPQLCCPDCGKPMEKYGYMGLGAIQIDRCNACSEVWVDATELQNMVIALAQSNYRSEDGFRRGQESRLSLGMGGGQSGENEPDDGLSDEISDGAFAAQVLVQLLRLLR
jgi:Zn-finger nucleic acid-binding protein